MRIALFDNITKLVIYKFAKQWGRTGGGKLVCKNMHDYAVERVLRNERRKTRHSRTFNDLEREYGLAIHLEIAASHRRGGCYCLVVQFELVSPFSMYVRTVMQFAYSMCARAHTRRRARILNFSQMCLCDNDNTRVCT